MILSPSIDKYLSYAERQRLDNYANNIETFKKRRDIASANADKLQSYANQFGNSTGNFPDNWLVLYVEGTKEILNWPNGGCSGGNGQFAVILWTEMNAFRAERDKYKTAVEINQKELDAHILEYTKKYGAMASKDAEKSRELESINVAANNDASIETRKVTTYVLLATVAIVALIYAFKKIN